MQNQYQNRLRRACVSCAMFVVCGATGPLGATADECTPEWTPGVGSQGVIVAADTIVSLDDGESVSHFISNNGVAQWTGSEWTQLGEGQLLVVRAMAGFDDGTGFALYAGPEGAFLEEVESKGVVRWDGTKWVAVGNGPGVLGAAVFDMIIFDDGSGRALYAGGFFVGGPTPNLSRWDGRTWSPVVGGPNSFSSHSVRTMEVFDDGSGPALYVGGNNLQVNGVPTSVAKWDGSTWTAVAGAPTNTIVLAMTVHDNGSGPALYVGGMSSPNPWNFPVVNRYDGNNWSVVGTPLNGTIRALASFDDGTGTGPSLYIGGSYVETVTKSGTQPIAKVARLVDSQWQSLPDAPIHSVHALLSSVDIVEGQAPALLVSSNSFEQWRGCEMPSIPGDLNGNGLVNISDLLILLGAWGICADVNNCPADLNGDGVVNVSDLLILLANWG